MKKNIYFISISVSLCFFLFLSGGCSKNISDNHTLTISAASSLQGALGDIKKMYTQKYPNTSISFNFAGSGSLQQQIIQGAPVDLFFSAAEDKFQQLVTRGYIQPSDQKNLLKNELVVITPPGKTISTLEDLQHLSKIAIGAPESVPAGKYAKETLSNLHLWDELQQKLILTKDVRQALTYVETGNVEAGIVYKTDALTSKNIGTTLPIDPTLHSPIVYPVGIITESTQKEEANKFLTYLTTAEAKEVFENYGFQVIQSKEK